MPKGKKKKSLIGWTCAKWDEDFKRKDFGWSDETINFPLLKIRKDFNLTKVRITIEEL